VPRRWVTLYMPLAIFLFVLLFPFYWMAHHLVQAERELLSRDGNPFWVIAADAGAHQEAAVRHRLPGWLWNTMVVSVVATFLSLAASVLAAYAIERLRFQGAKPAGWRSSSPTWCRRRSCSSRWRRSSSSSACSTPAGR
jgi:multiple sugar transport system permease protein